MSNHHREYSNGNINIIWNSGKCIHAGVCVKMLPKVYNPKGRPWIKPENATTDELKNQIDQCPSGALSYVSTNPDDKSSSETETVVEVLENGPLIVYGTLKITDSDGTEEKRNKTTAFCRCGASKNKPYCDGSHTKIDFQG